ncbi:universal stress protein [Phaeobacter gallaeciensis]|uniref:Universal stress protein n=1 Tax=Phaeobacter gallaeciensis TaxID=60890 RepID=A0AAC9ZAG6_9RHOB|nr:universal stress protein [Phaeobacter gallaeciensis]AHD10513.1 Universal stress protein UspA [Phaeobacter gallaeciensis DSM 26640]ATE93776.1 putative universal stress protein [Phaeobacter gallaeciensis]ATE96403.1 putative universal stress protein [Phaeobacter gallaeciensis]ATF02440.1 putative universal stress protein [Phaeobacter gallaeciensis]ATF06820.1 putative universal stress protein [Phaeobacter gallaeciensis]
MASKIVVGYDGSTSARTALNFALDVAKAQGGSIVVAHVLEWSPYSFLSASELAERHKRRTEELERAETALIQPLLKDLETSGVDVTATVKYGNIAEVLVSIAKSEGANHVVIGRTGHSALSSRLFGSVAGSLAQAAPVPVTIVP